MGNTFRGAEVDGGWGSVPQAASSTLSSADPAMGMARRLNPGLILEGAGSDLFLIDTANFLAELEHGHGVEHAVIVAGDHIEIGQADPVFRSVDLIQHQ